MPAARPSRSPGRRFDTETNNTLVAGGVLGTGFSVLAYGIATEAGVGFGSLSLSSMSFSGGGLGGAVGMGLNQLGIGGGGLAGQAVAATNSTVSMAAAQPVPTTTGTSTASPNAAAQNRGGVGLQGGETFGGPLRDAGAMSTPRSNLLGLQSSPASATADVVERAMGSLGQAAGDIISSALRGASLVLSLASILNMEDDQASRIVYHYTSTQAAALIRVSGLYSQSSATTVGTYTAQQAVELLGVKTPPEVLVEIRDVGFFVPKTPRLCNPILWDPVVAWILPTPYEFPLST